MLPNLAEYSGKKILITGHTGFKGSWLSRILVLAGAEVHGISLPPEEGSIYSVVSNLGLAKSNFIDIRDRSAIDNFFHENNFDGIFHLAAQPLVLKSYEEPLETFDTNVMGTANLLNSVMTQNVSEWIVVVTTDKVYKNLEVETGYIEDDALGGKDPYSASKSATEMVVNAWRALAEFKNYDLRICAVRAGNVIGGGDVAKDRLIPDLVRSFQANQKAIIRNPNSVRPWQHVLDPLNGYLTVGKFMMNKVQIAPAYNFGPNEDSKLTVEQMAQISCRLWENNKGFTVEKSTNNSAESKLLWLSAEAAKRDLGWKNELTAEDAIGWTLEWQKMADLSEPLNALDKQILKYFQGTE